MSVQFISRHEPSQAQLETVRVALGEDLVHDPDQGGVIFDRETNPAEALAPLVKGKRVALVAPGWVVLSLLRQGWTVIEFVNQPSAREWGRFLLEGMYIHTLEESKFIPSAIPPEKQEEQPIR